MPPWKGSTQPTKRVRIRIGGIWYELARRLVNNEQSGDPVFDWTEYDAHEVGGNYRFPMSAQQIFAKADLFA